MEKANKEKLNNEKFLMDLFRRLSYEDKVLLGLYFYENLKVGEIATVLKCDAAVVVKRLNKMLPNIIHESSRSMSAAQNF